MSFRRYNDAIISAWSGWKLYYYAMELFCSCNLPLTLVNIIHVASGLICCSNSLILPLVNSHATTTGFLRQILLQSSRQFCCVLNFQGCFFCQNLQGWLITLMWIPMKYVTYYNWLKWTIVFFFSKPENNSNDSYYQFKALTAWVWILIFSKIPPKKTLLLKKKYDVKLSQISNILACSVTSNFPFIEFIILNIFRQKTSPFLSFTSLLFLLLLMREDFIEIFRLPDNI